MTISFEVDKNLEKLSHHHGSFTADEKALKYYLGNSLGNANIKDGGVEAYAFNFGAGSNHYFPDLHRNSLMYAVYEAFTGHQPLTFGPDEIWLTICQAAAKYIEKHPEDARKSLVAFEGKQLLTVDAHHLVRGGEALQWKPVFEGFSNKIAEFLGNKRDLFDPTFSTTSWIEKAAIQVQMMAALAPYFDYKVMTLCGIPKVTLLGTVEDWESVHTRTQAFHEFLPSWAVEGMSFATHHLVQSAKGHPDMEFWQNFFKTRNGSGGTPIGGFINALFPYLDTGRPNKALEGGDIQAAVLAKKDSGSLGISNQLGDFGGSVSNVPMLWNYLGETIRMRLATGVFGVTYDNESGYRPVTGWVIGEDKTDPKF